MGLSLSRKVRFGMTLAGGVVPSGQVLARCGTRVGMEVWVRGPEEAVTSSMGRVPVNLTTTEEHTEYRSRKAGKTTYIEEIVDSQVLASSHIADLTWADVSRSIVAREAGRITACIPFDIPIPVGTPSSTGYVQPGRLGSHATVSSAVQLSPQPELFWEYIHSSPVALPIVVGPATATRSAVVAAARPTAAVDASSFLFYNDKDRVTVRVTSDVVPRGGAVAGEIAFARESSTEAGLISDPMDVGSVVVSVVQSYWYKGRHEHEDVVAAATYDATEDSMVQAALAPHQSNSGDAAEQATDNVWATHSKRRISRAERVRRADTAQQIRNAYAAGKFTLPFSINVPAHPSHFGVDGGKGKVVVKSHLCVTVRYNAWNRLSVDHKLPIRLVSPTNL